MNKLILVLTAPIAIPAAALLSLFGLVVMFALSHSPLSPLD